jgi:hypothetical protein
MVYATMMLCWKDGRKTRCKFEISRMEINMMYCDYIWDSLSKLRKQKEKNQVKDIEK